MNDSFDEMSSYSRSNTQKSVLESFVCNVEFLLPETRNFFESDKKCQICQVFFNVPGLSHTKKEICKFCYHGVCTRDLQYEYFHSESQKLEKMCSNCHQILLKLNKEFENQVKFARLEKIQLNQEIDLAVRQKENFENERKKLENEIKLLTNHLMLSNQQKIKILQEESEKNAKLAEKFENFLQVSVGLTKGIQELESEFLQYKDLIKEINASNDEILKANNNLKEEYNALQNLKIDLMKSNSKLKKKAVNSEYINELNEEIHEIEEELSYKNKLISEVEGSLKENEEETQKLRAYYDELLQSLMLKRTYTPNFVVEKRFTFDELNPEETKKIEELQEQIHQQDMLIETLQNRINLFKQSEENNKKESFKAIEENYSVSNKSEKNKSLYMISHELVEEHLSRASTKNYPKTDDKSDTACQRCLVI